MEKFLSLGNIPLVNRFLTRDELKNKEPKFPLDVYFCKDCGMVQLGEVVPPEIMFTNYPYLSSTSDTMKKHFADFAKEAVEKFGKGLIIDIGGNDGTLLVEFKKLGMKTLNVDPATNISEISRIVNEIETINDFWNSDLSKQILKNYGKAKLITGTNVFAHVDDLDDFINAAKIILEDDGALVVEFPYLLDMISKTEFDTIYHEHLSYISIRPMIGLFNRLGMEIVDAVRSDVHGGSIRIYAMKSGNGKISPKINKLIELEKGNGLDSFHTYENFGEKVEEIKMKLVRLLKNLKAQGKKIAGYGAPAKGNVLMNFAEIGPQFLEFIVDKNVLKQNLFTPGTHLKVFPPEKIYENKPDYLLIFAWNFADEIMNQQSKFKDLGGKFIIPIPDPKII